MKITLPTTRNPPRIRKDGSCSLSFDTRELNSEEIFTIMSLRNTEGWLCYAPNEDEIEVPEERAEVDTKTPAQRIRSVLYILYQQDTERGKYTGLFQTYYADRMEKLIELLKAKIDE